MGVAPLRIRQHNTIQYRCNNTNKKRGVEIENEYVVGRLNGTPFTNFNKAWQIIRNACGFTKKLNLHDHRHTYCTNIVLAGSSTKHAASMIAHNAPRMTERNTNLEGLLHNPMQDKLAAHYENKKNPI